MEGGHFDKSRVSPWMQGHFLANLELQELLKSFSGAFAGYVTPDRAEERRGPCLNSWAGPQWRAWRLADLT